jgi:shikimate dehydrogenase
VTRHAAVIGQPVAHSRSPAIFGFLSRRLSTPLDYQRREIAPDALPAAVQSARGEAGLLGWNVTIPHKERIVGLLDSVAPEALAVGAVNVVHRLNGTLRGHNTDVLGVERTFSEHGVEVKGARCLLLGAGGAARAAAYSLGRAGAARVQVWNRSHGRAGALCASFNRLFPGTRFEDLPHGLEAPDLSGTAVVVNATPLGMSGYAGDPPRLPPVSAHAFVFDLVYNPEETPLIQQARARGLRCTSGLDMLAWQALGTWELWVGPIAGAEKVKTELMQILKEAK